MQFLEITPMVITFAASGKSVAIAGKKK